jgi:Tfp pilus assembly protein PilF
MCATADEDRDMRFDRAVPLLLLMGTIPMMVAAASGPSGDDVIKPQSLQMAEQGRMALTRGDALAAIDAYEAALASDPKNVAAFTGIAMSYEKLGLPGKAVKYYREALALNPSDLVALEGQGKAYVARGATARAQVNLARMKALCKADCGGADRLQTAIDAAAAQAPKTVATK